MKRLFEIVTRFVFGYLLTIGIILGSQYTWYAFLDSHQVPELKQPFIVLNENKEVRKGDYLRLEITFRKPEPLYVTSTRQITCSNGDIVVLGANTAQLPVTDEWQTVNISVALPETLNLEPDQTCIYQVRGTADLDRYENYTADLVSEPFKLVR